MVQQLTSSRNVWIGLVLSSGSALAVVSLITYHRRRNHQSDATPQLVERLGRRGQKEVAKKQYLQAKEQHKGGLSDDTTRCHTAGAVPPGNFVTKRWIPTGLGLPLPSSWKGDTPDQWELTLITASQPGGDTKTTTRTIITFDNVQQLASWPTRVGPYSWHCVTGWTCHNLVFYGVLLQEVLDMIVVPQAESDNSKTWQWLFQTSADGYTAPIHRDDLTRAYLVLQMEQQQQQQQQPPLSKNQNIQWIDREHGGPRIVVDSLWGWKSAKWLTQIELLESFKPGFWEAICKHPRGRVYDATAGANHVYLQERWAEEGYWTTIMPVLTSFGNLYHHLGGAAVYQTVLHLGGAFLGQMYTAFRAISGRPYENPSKVA